MNYKWMAGPALLCMAACNAAPAGIPASQSPALSSTRVAPASGIQIRPQTVVFNAVAGHKKVIVWAPGASEKDECAYYNIADVTYTHRVKLKAYYIVTPIFHGHCVCEFIGKNGKTGTLNVIVK